MEREDIENTIKELREVASNLEFTADRLAMYKERADKDNAFWVWIGLDNSYAFLYDDHGKALREKLDTLKKEVSQII